MDLHRLPLKTGLRALAQTWVLALCVVTLATGCYTNRLIPAQNLSAITVPNHGRELVLRDRDGRAVRVGPNTRIRFLVRGNLWTGWFEGRNLRVNRVGASVRRRGQDAKLVARWSDIYAAEVRNLHGGRTFGAVLAVTVLVGVVLLALAGGGKGGGKGLGKGFGKAFRGAGRGAARVGAGIARGLARGVLWHGFRLGVHLHPVHVDAGSPAPPPTAAPGPHPPAAGGAPPPPPPPPAPGAAPQPGWTTPQPAFSRLLQRRSQVRFLASVGGGSDLVTHDTATAAAFVGLRAYDVLDIALGARMYHHRGTRLNAEEDYRQSWMAVARVMGHFDLDKRRWVALPIGVDVGGGHARIHVRLNLGLRIRILPWLHLGLYPFNPTYTHFRDDTLKRDLVWWSFPSELELTFAF